MATQRSFDQIWMDRIRSTHDEAVHTDYPWIRDLWSGFNEGGFQSRPYDPDPTEQILNSQKVIADLIPSIEYWMNALDLDSEMVSVNLISTDHFLISGRRFSPPSPVARTPDGAAPRWLPWLGHDA
jgi:hypothetical protein